MNLHEYQAKKILAEYGIVSPPYKVISSVEEGLVAYDEMGCEEVVVKVQIHAGGRGKAGGVKLAKGKEAFLETIKSLFALKVINQQTGPMGMMARQLLISEVVEINKEYYIGAVINREKGVPVLIFSVQGGMAIEDVAAAGSAQIIEIPFDGKGKYKEEDLAILDQIVPLDSFQIKQIASAIAKLFIDCDASVIEINPLVVTNQGEIVALDAKMAIDDNSLFRHPDLAQLYDPFGQTPSEAVAHAHGLVYIPLDGEIGCLVNGAGLAMATMDIITLCGGRPANFLDVGGSASKEKVKEACKIILADSKVKAILINIFGGIMSCRTIAEGVVWAAHELQPKVPLIVRLEGSEVEAGKKILGESELNIVLADSLDDAAIKAVAISKR